MKFKRILLLQWSSRFFSHEDWICLMTNARVVEVQPPQANADQSRRWNRFNLNRLKQNCKSTKYFLIVSTFMFRKIVLLNVHCETQL